MGSSDLRYGSYRESRLPRQKRTIPLPGDFDDHGRYYQCWNCGAVNDIRKHHVDSGKHGRSGVTVKSNLALLLHMDGTNGSTTFTDSSPLNAKTVAASGNAQISTAQYKFSTASGLFDGTGDYLSTPDHTDFDLSGGIWTVDFWVRGNWSGTGNEGIYFQRTDANNYFSIYVTKAAAGYGLTLSIYASGSETVNLATGAGHLKNTTFHHVEVSEFGNDYRIAIDGDMRWHVEDANRPANYSGTVYIGCTAASGSPGEYFTGNLDEFRVGKYANHFGGFDVETVAYDTDSYIPGVYYPDVNKGCWLCGSTNYR